VSRWTPETTATRETAQWLLDEMRRDLADAETPEEAAEIVARHSYRVSSVVLDVACALAGVGRVGLEAIPTRQTLAVRLVTSELRRLGLP
jgi:hypothetical protein